MRIIRKFLNASFLVLSLLSLLLVLLPLNGFALENDIINPKPLRNLQSKALTTYRTNDQTGTKVDSENVVNKKNRYDSGGKANSNFSSTHSFIPDKKESRVIPSFDGINSFNYHTDIVPHLIGLSYERAIVILHSKGLSVGEIRNRGTSDNRGIVVEQSPTAGQKVETRKVDLVLSVARQLSVPDLIGKTVDSAKVLLHKSGFTLGSTRNIESESGTGLIVRQQPSSGTHGWGVSGSAISIVVSKPLSTVVPNVIGQSDGPARPSQEKTDVPLVPVISDSLKPKEIADAKNQKVDSSAIATPAVDKNVNLNHPQTKPVLKPVNPAIIPKIGDILIITGGAVIILAGGSLLWSRIRAKNIHGSVGKNANIYAQIDYGKQQVTLESLATKAVACNRDISIRILPDKGIQEIQVSGSLVQSD